MSVANVSILFLCGIVFGANRGSLARDDGEQGLLMNGTNRTAEARPEDNHFWDPLGLPRNFDARAKWFKCPSIGQVYDQGNCKSSYAVAVAAAISDRICVHSDGLVRPKLSAQQILSCCYLCGEGCYGGKHSESWDFYRRHGLVSGGGYGSDEGCQPYTIEPCQHATNADTNACSNKTLYTPECKVSCTNSAYGTRYLKDNHRGKYYKVPAYTAMKEIYEHGPITASFFMHQDLVDYKSGVYTYKTGRFVAIQAVKIIGWGEEDGKPYWLAVNSFNTYWGENGLFKILRGSNECYVEESMYAGLPL